MSVPDLSDKMLPGVIESIEDGAAIFDADDRLILFNDKYRQYFTLIKDILKTGISFEEMFQGLAERGLFSGTQQEVEHWVAGRKKLFDEGARGNEFERADGNWVRIDYYKLQTGGTFVITADITKQKQGEEALRRANEELKLRIAAENESRAKSNFLAAMSHELRTPLNAIIGFSEILEMGIFGPVNDQQKERIHDIHGASRHLLDLINDILDLSKVEAGNVELVYEDVDIMGTVERSIQLISDHAKSGEIQIHKALSPDLPTLQADERLFKQMLINLLSNAVKFTPAGGNITIASSKPADEWAQIEITDTGIGMHKKDIPTALAPFGQIGSLMTREQPGTGLGLPLVKAFMEYHGGRLELESEVGVGTVTRLLFPVP